MDPQRDHESGFAQFQALRNSQFTRSPSPAPHQRDLGAPTYVRHGQSMTSLSRSSTSQQQAQLFPNRSFSSLNNSHLFRERELPSSRPTPPPTGNYSICANCQFLRADVKLELHNHQVAINELTRCVDELKNCVRYLSEQLLLPPNSPSSTDSKTFSRPRNNSKNKRGSGNSGKKKKKPVDVPKINDCEKRLKDIQEILSMKLTGDDIYKFFRHFYDRIDLESKVSDLNRLSTDYRRVNKCFTELTKLGDEAFNPESIYTYFSESGLRECSESIKCHSCIEVVSSCSYSKKEEGSEFDSPHNQTTVEMNFQSLTLVETRGAEFLDFQPNPNSAGTSNTPGPKNTYWPNNGRKR